MQRIGRTTPLLGGWRLTVVLAPLLAGVVFSSADQVVSSATCHESDRTVQTSAGSRGLKSAAWEEPSTTKSTPRRIITIAPNSAEIICALGACDRLVGVSKFCVFPPELFDRPRVGGLFDPNLEKIIALRPDLVVIRGKNQAVVELCNKRGIKIYHDGTDTLADVSRCIIELGNLVAKPKRAKELVKGLNKRLATFRDRVKDLRKPRVLMTVARQPDRLVNLLTAGKGTFLDEMIDLAGGVNIFGHLDMMYPQVSLEAIIAQRPDVIIELMPEVEMTDVLRNALLEQWATLKSIPAVTDKQIYFVTDNHALIPSPRYIQIIEKVARLLHPEMGDE